MTPLKPTDLPYNGWPYFLPEKISMPLVAKSEGPSDFSPCPPGQYACVCVDVVDLGYVTEEWNGEEKTSHKCRIAFLVDELDPKTHKMYWIGGRYTVSLHEKANLRKFLQQWRGTPFTQEELEGFDVEKLIGVGAYIQVVQNVRGDKTYANIDSIMRLPKGMKTPTYGPEDYIRVKDRPEGKPGGKAKASNGHADHDPGPQDTGEEDSDCPF